MNSRGKCALVRCPVESPTFCRSTLSVLPPCSQLSKVFIHLSAGCALQRSLRASGLTFSVILLLHLSAEFDTVTTLGFVKYSSPISIGDLILSWFPSHLSDMLVQFLSLAIRTLTEPLSTLAKYINLEGWWNEVPPTGWLWPKKHTFSGVQRSKVKVSAMLAPSQGCEGRTCSRLYSLACRWPSSLPLPMSLYLVFPLCVFICPDIFLL